MAKCGESNGDSKTINCSALTTTEKGNLCWIYDFEGLREFIDGLKLSPGKWTSPGGGCKMFENGQISIRWYLPKGTLTLKGDKSSEVKNRLLSLIENVRKGRPIPSIEGSEILRKYINRSLMRDDDATNSQSESEHTETDNSLNNSNRLNATLKSDLFTSTFDVSSLLELEQFIDCSFDNINKDGVLNIPIDDTTSTVDGMNCPVTAIHHDLVERITNLELFKEKVAMEINSLHEQLDIKDNVIEKYEHELCKLREDNLNIKSRISAMESRSLTTSQGTSVDEARPRLADHDDNPNTLHAKTVHTPISPTKKSAAHSNGSKPASYGITIQVEEYKEKHRKRFASQLSKNKQAPKENTFPKQQAKHTSDSRQKSSIRIPYLMNIQTHPPARQVKEMQNIRVEQHRNKNMPHYRRHNAYSKTDYSFFRKHRPKDQLEDWLNYLDFVRQVA